MSDRACDDHRWLLTFPPLFGLLWIVGLLPELSDDTKAIIEVVYIFLLVGIRTLPEDPWISK